MSQKLFARDLVDKQVVQSVFLVREKHVQTGKNGKSYMALSLGDKTGFVDGRIWDNVDELNEQFEIDDFIFIKGVAQNFQNRVQLVIHNIEVVSSASVNISDFLPTSKFNSEDMFAELQKILAEIKNPFVKTLMNNVLEDPEIKPLFLTCPAAKSIHHAYIGGLLEHVLSICHIMRFLATHYRRLDLDLLLFGAVFHDIGKIWELKFDTSIGYTDVGRLVGHIPMGSELIEKKASQIPNFPYDLKNVLKHLVLSHHGKLEYGSPKRPKFPEALVVSYIDDLDSKVNSLFGILDLERSAETKWTRFSQLFDRYLYTETGHAETDLE